jgi:hypothetical protein
MSMSLNPVKANIGVMMDQLQKITPKIKFNLGSNFR